MKLIGYRENTYIWELSPRRRTITCKDQRFFVPFPWTYFLTKGNRENYVLMCGIRPQKITTTSKEIYVLHTDNLFLGFKVCLGRDRVFRSITNGTDEDFAKELIDCYFSTSFDTPFINFKNPAPTNFEKWASCETFEDIEIQWDRLILLLSPYENCLVTWNTD